MKTKFRQAINFGFGMARTQTAKDSLISLIGSGLSGFLALVFTAVVARILSPEKFGQFSTVINYILLIAALNDLGINQSLVYFMGQTKGREKKNWAKLILKMVLGLSLIFASLGAFFFWFLLSSLWQIDESLGLLIFISIVISGLYFFFVYLFQAFKSFFKKALFENIFSITRMVFLGGVLLFLDLNVALSILAVIIAELLSIVFGWLASPVKLARAFSVKLKTKKIKKLLGFSKWLGLNNLFIQTYGKIDILMLAWLASSFTTGIYSSAARLMLAFPVIISSFSSVVAPRFASFSDPLSNLAYFKKVFLASLGIAVSMGASMMIAARPLIYAVYGEAYLSSVPAFRILTVAFLPLVLSIPVTNSLIYFFKKPFAVSFISGIQLVVVVGLNLFFIPRFSSLGPAFSLLTANLSGLILGYLFFVKELKTAKQSVINN